MPRLYCNGKSSFPMLSMFRSLARSAGWELFITVALFDAMLCNLNLLLEKVFLGPSFAKSLPLLSRK